MVKDAQPKISVIVPVYNVERYLKRCVESIINQTYQNLEIILVNDGSPDNCGLICDEFAQRDRRISVIHQENKGLSGARNSGMRVANGDYIAFVDSDDWVDLDMYETMLSYLLKHKADVVECNIIQRTETGQKVAEESNLVEIQDRLSALKRIVTNQQFSVCRRLYKKQAIEGISFPEGKISEDVYFTSTLFERLDNIVFLSNNFYNYYVVTESITRGPYKLKTLESIDAAFFLKDKIGEYENDITLKPIIDKFIMTILVYNYKLLNHNPSSDTGFKYRTKIRQLIVDNTKVTSISSSVILVSLLGVRSYASLIHSYKKLKSLFKR